jgi:hypothetical protein
MALWIVLSLSLGVVMALAVDWWQRRVPDNEFVFVQVITGVLVTLACAALLVRIDSVLWILGTFAVTGAPQVGFAIKRAQGRKANTIRVDRAEWERVNGELAAARLVAGWNNERTERKESMV